MLRPPSLATLLLVLLVPLSAAAQDSRTEVARREILERAERARAEGNHTAALDLATQAARIRQTPSLRLLLAQEHRALGRLVEALDHATGCVREAEADATLRNRERLIEVCRSLAAEVEPSLGRIAIHVTPSAAPSLRVRVAGAELPVALLGVPSPSMPGRIEVRIEAEGFEAATRAADVVAGRESRVDVTLTRTGAAEVPRAAPVAATQTPISTQSGGPGAAPWVLVGGGAAVLGAAAVLFAMSNGARDDRDTACGVNGCLDRARDDDARYRDLLLGANVALGVGAAATLGGLVWWLVGRGSTRSSAWASVAPLAQGALLEIGGTL